MISEKVENTLKDLGLTEYETKAYVGLVSSGPCTAGDLSDISGVPHSRIYDVLSKLEKKGWIDSQSGRPSRYRAKPPSEVMRLVRMKQKEKFKKASETIEKELEPLYEEKGELEKPEVWTIRGKKEIIERIKRMFMKSEIEVLISIPELTEEFSNLKNFLPLIETKNLDFKLLTSKENELTNNLKDVENVKLKFRRPLFGGGVIIDGKEVLLVLKGNEGTGRSLGIWSDEGGLVKYATEYFKYLWDDSKEGIKND